MKPIQLAGMLACGAALASAEASGQTTTTTFTLEAAGCTPVSSTGTSADCGSELTNFLTSASVSGVGTTSLEFDGTPGQFYYFKTPWTMPANVTLNLKMDAARRPGNGVWGLNTAPATSSWGPGFGGILLDTGQTTPATIIMTNNDTIENGACINFELPTPANPNDAVAAIQNSFSGTCVTISPNKANGLYGSDDLVRDMTIVGFKTAIAEISTSAAPGMSGRLGIENVYCDAITCVDDRYSKDFSHIRTLYANNLYAGPQLNFTNPYTVPEPQSGCSGPTSTLTGTTCSYGLHPGILAYRAGPLINVEATSDDLDITDIESYGHQTAVCARDVYVLSIHGLKSEINAQTVAGTTPIYGTMTATTYGIIALGSTNLLLSGGFEFGGRTYGLYLTNYGGNVVANGTVQVGGGSNADYVYIAPPNASTPTCLSTVSPTGTGTVAGNFSNVTFKGPSPVFAIGAATNVSMQA